MRVFKKSDTPRTLLAASLVASFTLAAPVQSAVVVYAWDAGADVRIAWNGSLDLTGLSEVENTSGNQFIGSGDQVINAQRGTAQLFPEGLEPDGPGLSYLLNLYAFDSFSQPTGAVPGTFLKLGTTLDFDFFEGIYFFDADVATDPNAPGVFLSVGRERLGVSSVYESGNPIAGSGILWDSSLDSLEIFSGNYRFNLADSTEYVEFRFGEAPAPVPLPPAFGMLMAGLAGLRWFARRHPA